jgi:hypothetical protein
VFLCHASEDKDFARSLAAALERLGVDVWFDEVELNVGDSLTGAIDRGLSRSSYGVVVLSPSFFRKKWPPRELGGMVAKAKPGHGRARILPIWHKISEAQIVRRSPTLADVRALNSRDDTADVLALKILRVVRPDRFDALKRLAIFEERIRTGRVERVPAKSLRMGPARHEALPESLIVRIRLVHEALHEVVTFDFDHAIDLYKHDVHPEREVQNWERLAAAYLKVVGEGAWTIARKTAVFRVLLGALSGATTEELIERSRPLRSHEVQRAVETLAGVGTPQASASTGTSSHLPRDRDNRGE